VRSPVTNEPTGDSGGAGWVLIVMGVVQALTTVGVWMQLTAVRWIGVAIAALNAIVQMFFICAYPFWSLTLFTLDILVIYGLGVTTASSRRAATTSSLEELT
jgi:hypothetical protein